MEAESKVHRGIYRKLSGADEKQLLKGESRTTSGAEGLNLPPDN